MSYYPKITVNAKHLKIKNNQIEQQINALMKEKETVVKCLHNDEIRFRNKYEKFYFRKGLIDLQKRRFVSSKTCVSENNTNQNCSSVGLHTLIFTKGEIDIEKVLCLHLLTVYDIKNDHEICSLQNLLKHNNTKKQSNKSLPNYIAEFYYKSKLEIWPESSTKKVCLIVNCYLENLIDVILNVLQEINSIKFDQIVQLSRNAIALDNLMQKPKIVSMVDKLKENQLVTDILNFRTEMRTVINLNSSYTGDDSKRIMRIKIKDTGYKLHLIKEEIKQSLRKKMQIERKCSLGSTLSLLQRKLRTGTNLNLDNSIMTLTNRFIDLSSISAFSSEELALFANIDNMLQSNSNLLLEIQSRKIIHPSMHIRQSLYSNYSNHRRLMPFSLRTKRGAFMIESESERIMQSILQKLNHGQRIMVGKRAAQLKSNDIIQGGLGGQKTQLASLVADVLTTESLISLACSSCNEELQLIMAPCSKGGLGMGEHITEYKTESNLALLPSRQKELNDWKSLDTDMKAIKQMFLTQELKSRVNLFVKTENP